MNTTSREEQYPASRVDHAGTVYSMVKVADGSKQLLINGNADGFVGTAAGPDKLLCPRTAENAATLRARLPWLVPQPLGVKSSFGFGDRIGAATPGHVAAVRGTGIAPIFAQQSVRENTRIGRTPQQVMDDAMWGLFETGWQNPWGADADHVKTVDDLPAFVDAGYTFFTIDPSDHVDNAAQTDSREALRAKVASLPWERLGSDYHTIYTNYRRTSPQLDNSALHFDEEILLRALAKYGWAIAHTLTINDALASLMAGRAYDLEMSVDETDTPTSVHEHFYIANELINQGVPVVSLAPRFVGKFQKGVDYIGDTTQFEHELVKHVAILRYFNHYKLSIHTGSDKFSIYPIIAKHAGRRVHVKTAGTSYLEALRAIAESDPAFFRTILDFSRAHFEHDRKSYFLDCRLDRVPAAGDLTDAQLPGLLDQFDARQVLHVTFGSVLDHFDTDLHAFIAAHENEYAACLKQHFDRHLAAFVTP
ncbi:MAG: hypothetical protein KDD78_12825 [Caldilineaceae bacterium]|nr:hypothetical protein [Caldilineaceae bacterium]